MISRPTNGVHCIVAICKKFGIGYENKLPWHIPEDLAKFNRLTQDGVVVMGRATYDSLPYSKRPLPNRLNLVMTRGPKTVGSADVIQGDMNDIVSLVKVFSKHRAVWIIGGQEIYEFFFSHHLLRPSTLWLTSIERSFVCDRRFPMPSGYKLVQQAKYHNQKQDCVCRDLVYRNDSIHSSESQYIDLLIDVCANGSERVDRTGVGTKSVFGRTMRFDLTAGFPILTTKFVSWRVVIEELLWFLKGETDSKTLEAKQVDIWKQNTSREFISKRGLDLEVGDVGGMYGYVWRHGGHKYTGPQSRQSGNGTDQLTYVLDTLKTDPFSRRIIMTSNDVTNLETGVLYPCHGLLVQFYVEVKDGTKYLSCSMTQRSADCFLGLPINIASYATLTHILARKTDMIPKDLIINLNDTHIYNNHRCFVEAQLSRCILPLPWLILSDEVKTKPFEDLTIDDFELAGYLYHPAMKAPMAV